MIISHHVIVSYLVGKVDVPTDEALVIDSGGETNLSSVVIFY